MKRLAALVLACSFAVPGVVMAQEQGYAEDGKDIYVVCAPCHGPEGQGGGGGDYPRLAGFSTEYLISQLKAFKARERVNIPMYPFTVERELNDQDILDVSAYITKMTLDTRLPEMEGQVDGYERLLAAKRVLQIPRAPGDVDKGAALYKENCARCHGEKGEGRPHDPPLAGQYIKYLAKQFREMRADARLHPRPKRLIVPLSEDDVQNLLAYFSTLDD
ncbi:c-type cytochrome [Magnetovibrio sp.]|uniref:c-type cytochrome n=1 Tax=Magnetovibrio sp. TaxID=2024836 RepID=UPI002F954C4F